MQKLYIIILKKITITAFAAILLILIFTFFFTKINLVNIFNQKIEFKSNLEPSNGKLAIIIDDLGSSRLGVKEMFELNEHLTFAIIPFEAYSVEDAITAHEKGYEVIVHLPMESFYGKRSWLGTRPIMVGMDANEITQIVFDAFKNVPYSVGANIHMGSKASRNESIMSAVLDVLQLKNVYFVDSCTADQPVAKKIANNKGVLCYDRDVFLDGNQSKHFVKDRLAKAANIASKKGYAIAIGHVGPEGGKITAEAIKEMLPEFKKSNITLSYVSELTQKNK